MLFILEVVMNLDDFLRNGSTDLLSVVDSVDSAFGLNADDILLAVGSLAEGLGNIKSDLDLWLISPRAEHELPPQDNFSFVIGRCLVDMQILKLLAIENLLTRLDTWSCTHWNVTHATKFTNEERVLLHRLLHGQLLFHKNQCKSVTVPRPIKIDVARLKLHAARQSSRTIQVDMIGYKNSGDYHSLVYAAQELLGHAMDALLAGYQLTNPLSKWRSQLLSLLPSDWERMLPVRPTGLTACQLFWILHRAPEEPDKNMSLDHSFRILAFARAVFVWAELQFLNETLEQCESAIWTQLKRQCPEDSSLPYLDFDVDFCLEDGLVTLARLNDFGERVSMTRQELILCLLFDGTTTAREAEIVVYGSHSAGAVTSLTNRLAFLLA